MQLEHNTACRKLVDKLTTAKQFKDICKYVLQIAKPLRDSLMEDHNSGASHPVTAPGSPTSQERLVPTAFQTKQTRKVCSQGAQKDLLTKTALQQHQQLSQLKNQFPSKQFVDLLGAFKIDSKQISKLAASIFRDKNIRYHEMSRQQDFTIFLLCMPKGQQFSLHNHPNMVVATKCLYGSVVVQSMDRGPLHQQAMLNSAQKSKEADKEQQHLNQPASAHTSINQNSASGGSKKEASDKGTLHNEGQPSDSSHETKCQPAWEPKIYKIQNRKDKTLEQGEVTYVKPETGNIHNIIATKDSILLDMLLPDYHEQDKIQFYELYTHSRYNEVCLRTIPSPKQQSYLVPLVE